MIPPEVPLQPIQLPTGDWLLRIEDGIEEMLVEPSDLTPEVLAKARRTETDLPPHAGTPPTNGTAAEPEPKD